MPMIDDDPIEDPLGSSELADQYRAGFGKPPTHSRFRPGRSGTPQQGARSHRPELGHGLQGDRAVRLLVGITARVSGEAVYILDVVRERLDYSTLKRRIALEKQRWQAGDILIEDKGSGISLIQDLCRDGCFAVAILPETDKVVRMSACSARIEAGSVFRPHRALWLEEFQDELLAFPHGVHDDQVDALSQLLNWMRTRSPYNLAAMGS